MTVLVLNCERIFRLGEPIEVSTSTVLMHKPKQFAENANASREKENTMRCQAWLLV